MRYQDAGVNIDEADRAVSSHPQAGARNLVSLTLEIIHAAAAADRIKWRYHALQRARQRGISRH